MKPWTVKYAPQALNELIGQDSAIKELKESIVNYIPGKSLLIYGPNGTGKTSSVVALAKELDYDFIEVNASDVRNASSITEFMNKTIGQQSLLFKNKLILFDEVDGISGVKDRGGTQALLKVIAKSKFPIIMTTLDPKDRKVKGLKKVSKLIEFKQLNYSVVASKLEKICKEENIEYEIDALNRLARFVAGDLRAAINDLQSLSNKKITKETVQSLSERNKTQAIIDALMIIFKTTDPKVARTAIDDVNENIDELFLWLEENLPKEYTQVADLASGFQVLSDADVFFGRIRRWQYYRFYVYIYDLLSVGIALSKKEKYSSSVKYSQSGRLLKMWWAKQKSMKKRSVAEKISLKSHESKKQVYKETIPYLQFIARNDQNKINDLASYYELEKEEVEALSK